MSRVTLLSNRRPYQSTNLPFGKHTFTNRSIQIPLFYEKKSLNSDGQQFHKYQQNEEQYITSNLEHKKKQIVRQDKLNIQNKIHI